MNNSHLDPYYEILGLKPGASLLEVKQAYRNLVKTEHPDLFLHDPQLKQQAEEKFKKIVAAYKELQKFYYSTPNKTYHVRKSTDSVNTANSNTTPNKTYYVRKSTDSVNTTNSNTSNTANSVKTTSVNTASDTNNSSNTRTSILSRLRQYLPGIIAIVVVVNIANAVVWILTLRNSNPRNNSNPQNNPSPPIASVPSTTAPIPPTAPPTTSTALIQPTQCRIIAPTIGKSARLFSQATKEADTGRRIPKDTKVSFIGGIREFVEIRLSDQTRGWVFNDQIYPCTPLSNSILETASTSLQPQQCLIISPRAGRGARLFTQPTRDTFTGRRIPRDTKGSFIAASREFIQVSLPDQTRGWVFNDQVYPCTSESNSSPQTVDSSPQPQQCRIIAPTISRGARLFTQPAREASTGTRIPKDTRVSFISGVREFVQIELPDRTQGWVFNDQLYPCTPGSNSVSPTATASLTDSVQPQQCRIIAPTIGRGARLFTQPSREASTDTRIPKDTSVSFIEETGEFAHIELPDRTQGWVFNDQIQPCT